MITNTIWKVLRIVAALLLLAIAVFPIYWMILNSLLPTSRLFILPPQFLPVLGKNISYVRLFSSVPVLHWLRNSALVAVGTTILSVSLALFGAYGLSRFRFYGRGLVGFLLFTTQMLPEALIVVPYYAMFVTLGIINQFIGLVIATTAFIMPVLVWILKAAIDAVPIEIEESARIDGCSHLDSQFAIVLPLIAPSLAAAAVLAFFEAWNEYLFAVTLIFDETKRTTSVGLAGFIGNLSTPLDLVMATAVLFTLPAIVFYLLVQRYMVSGITAGAVKG